MRALRIIWKRTWLGGVQLDRLMVKYQGLGEIRSALNNVAAFFDAF